MRLWIDDTHPAPTGFVRVKTANAAKAAIRCYERAFSGEDIIVISIGDDNIESFDRLWNFCGYSIDDFVGLFSSFDSYDGVGI